MKVKTRLAAILLIACMLFSFTMVYGDSVKKKIEAVVNEINIQLNGTIVSADNILYKDTVFVSVRKFAEMLGKEVQFDSDSKTVLIKDSRVLDEAVIGLWNCIDRIEDISSYDPNVKEWNEELYIKEIDFQKDGRLYYINSLISEYSVWGDGVIFCGLFKDDELGDKRVAQHYFIKDINGEKYLFLEYKDGDYQRGTGEPIIYVFKK